MRSIAILATDSEAYSETFIQAHKKLRYRIHFYYGDVIPTTLEGSGPLMGNIKNLYYLIARRFSNSIFSANEMALKASLKKKKVECVLAEYGVVAAECLNVVKSLNLPLIVHFHGFDASEYRVLKEYGYRYKELFKYASSVIALKKKSR